MHQIAITEVAKGFEFALVETFENVRGMYLDQGTSFFETLDTLTAAQASQQISNRCATIAAHVAHTTFYLDTLDDLLLTKEQKKVDWAHIWQTISSVDDAAWQTQKNQLKASYQRVKGRLQDAENWQSEHELSCLLAIIAHSAYHLGEVRQMVCHLSA